MASSSNPYWRYDVFICFRGKDTRKGFTDHLYNALVQQGIDTFRDNEELERGKSIAPKLNDAIEQSRVAIVVFSKNYASSTWCLDELVKIVECTRVKGQTLLPVFYDVDPSDVRKQSGSFAEAFEAHERRLGDSSDKVQRWRATLTQVANLSGFPLLDRHETEFIQEIVQKVVSGRTPPSFPEDGLVGIGPRIYEIMKLHLEIETENDVGFIGIWGMGGIGKTTLAKCFHDKMYNQFDDISFLENVRESSAKTGGLGDLQERLLSDFHIKFLKRGFSGKEIKSRLCNKKVLIILDDVNELKQLEALAGSTDWFARGSRIIITTRDKHLLIAHGVCKIYEARKLNGEEALTLFSWNAFKNGCEDTEKYMELSQSFLKYAKGLPLAITILGKFLRGRSLTEWESTFARNQGDLDDKIVSVLQLGFDGLSNAEKEIFLDIACFFKGKDRVDASMVFESFGFFPGISISRLIENSLISIVEGRLWMHDLVQEMGWKIVRQQFPNEPGKWSRLWHWEDVLHVLNYNEGTNAVEGIVLNLPHEEKVSLSCDAFSRMKKLRYLKVSNALLPRGLKYLSTEFGFIEWHGYPSKLLPPNFPSGKLVQLNMHCSQIKLLWKGFKALEKLKSIELIDSESLIETPDFTGVPNLERLILRGCTRLHKIHPSIATLKRLVLLNMENCRSLENLPMKICLESLETFVLSGCARLKKFPEIVGLMGSLSKLYLDGTAIKELSSSIAHLSGLSVLDLKDCRNLLRLPSVISSLTAVKHMILSGCTSLEEIPEQIGDVESLEELDISGTAVREIPSSIVRLQNLKLLSCSGCKGRLSTLRMHGQFTAVCPGMALLLPPSFLGLYSIASLNLSDCNLLDGALPDDLDSLSPLRDLNLIGNNFTSIPESICRLPKLKVLLVKNCIKLQSLPKLPKSIECVTADGCISLRSDSNQYEVWNSWHSDKEQYLHIIKRSKSHTYGVVISALPFIAWLQGDHDFEVDMTQSLRPSYGFASAAHKVPSWFRTQSICSSVTMQLPRELDNDSLQPWRGLVLYVCCKVDDNFDTSSAFKIMHRFDFHFDTNQGQYPQQKQALHHEINVKGVPFTGPNGYWLYTPHAWFSQRVNALNECTSIEAHTETSCPGIKVQMSGARILFTDRNFIPFIQSVTADSWVRLKSRNPGSSSTTQSPTSTEEYRDHHSTSTMTLRQRLESLHLQTYESRKTLGGRKYIIEGNVDNPQIAFAVGEILQKYSSDDIFYTSCFPHCQFPKWFCRDIRVSDLRKNWKGIAVCITFTVHGPRTVELSNLDMKYILQTSTGLSLERIHHHTRTTSKDLKRLKQHDFMWISYTSRGSFAEYVWNECISLEVVYNEVTEDLKLQKCGYQLVFHDGMEDFVEALMQCSTTLESKNFKDEGKRLHRVCKVV